ncbi:divalent-cation tolerance protein CutA [Natronosporangium hydrolyticum]|uniref:Divalent-cation tolerance protein CutA n=1 Tax=Natronosporangium hydrolyticum TaxID=2811111 RepID=A0A895YHX3_9ACTN|nr:divalent-cation tolerance protein CutA [Natronosporangium hydrolyticum]QSB14156.1 divalent-cation tolerance protein CutA [Natronosporangium hydrolyticum]
MTDLWNVSTAVEDRQAAEVLAESALMAKLAASAQLVGPVGSMFWHHGEFGSAQEYQVIFRTTASCYQALQQHLIDNHPWKNPEVTAVSLAAASPQYARWVEQTVAED